MQVRTQQGLVNGLFEGGIFKFFGLPYAAPPVGELRWRPPELPDTWEGILDGTRFSSICHQVVGATSPVRQAQQSEDCLYVNIWTQSLDSTAKRPVMFWIHGGGNVGGAGSEENCDGSRLASKGAVIVSFNYRLGAFGFLAHPQIGANFGLLDQVAALHWVKQNISTFGGDSNNVTIFGESAGAVAVRALLSCPLANGYFHRAILQSAGFEKPAFTETWSYARAQEATEALFERLGTRNPAQLRLVDAVTVKGASHDLCGIPPPTGKIRTPADLVWMPVVDGYSVTGTEIPGWHSEVPVLLGCVENEARYFIRPNLPYSSDVLDNMSHSLCGPHHKHVLILLRSQANISDYDRMDKLMTTLIWTEPAFETLRKFSESGHRFYHYHFNRRSPGSINSNELAKHTVDIRYVFGNLNTDKELGYYNQSDEALSEAMQQAWLSFALDGVPKSHTSTGDFTWPRYDLSEPLTTWIGQQGLEVRPFPMTELMWFINSQRSKQSNE